MELARVAGEQFVCVDEKRAQVARDLKNSTFVQQAVRIRLVPLRSISTTSARADTVSAELNRPAATQYARVLCVSPTGQVFSKSSSVSDFIIMLRKRRAFSHQRFSLRRFLLCEHHNRNESTAFYATISPFPTRNTHRWNNFCNCCSMCKLLPRICSIWTRRISLFISQYALRVQLLLHDIDVHVSCRKSLRRCELSLHPPRSSRLTP